MSSIKHSSDFSMVFSIEQKSSLLDPREKEAQRGFVAKYENHYIGNGVVKKHATFAFPHFKSLVGSRM